MVDLDRLEKLAHDCRSHSYYPEDWMLDNFGHRFLDDYVSAVSPNVILEMIELLRMQEKKLEIYLEFFKDKKGSL